MIPVVAGIICNKQNQILIAYRSSHVIQGDQWEFPGGKIEAGEMPFDALVRELKEEIGITIISAHPFKLVEYTYPGDRTIQLDVWWVDSFEGVPSGQEGQVIQWVTADILSDLQFPEGNKLVIEELQNIFSK